jgi:hypothetical protein
MVVWQVVSHKFLRPLVPFAMAGAFFTNFLAATLPALKRDYWARYLPPVLSRLVLALQLTFYILASLNLGENKRGRIGKLLYLPSFLVNSNLAALAGLYGYLTGTQSAVWERVERGQSVKRET